MAWHLLIYREGFQELDAQHTIAQIEAMPGVKDCRYKDIPGALFECSYSDPAANDRHRAVVLLHGDAKAIGLTGPEIHTFGFAFALQSIHNSSLHLTNTGYEFDLRIGDFSSPAELVAAATTKY